MENWANKILNIKNDHTFNELAIQAFNFQYQNIDIYHSYCNKLGINPDKVQSIKQIPFLPIELFKTHKIIHTQKDSQSVFSSSGTTGTETSKHFVASLELYEQSFMAAFKQFYGDINDYCILALLPSYIEKGGSSLVYMTNKLISKSKHPDSGFYLNNYHELVQKLNSLKQTKSKVILLGVSYALLDIAEQFNVDLHDVIIMETGGMKGRRKEIIREELHKTLQKAFQVNEIHSEYGMTELLSQGYSKGKGIFETPNWMKIMIRDTYDPFHFINNNQSGGINVIDLANIYSCCFIETKDLGKVIDNNSFTILGRFDNSDIRGCNLMAQ